jgi:hypothetical protein
MTLALVNLTGICYYYGIRLSVVSDTNGSCSCPGFEDEYVTVRGSNEGADGLWGMVYKDKTCAISSNVSRAALSLP